MDPLNHRNPNLPPVHGEVPNLWLMRVREGDSNSHGLSATGS